MCGVLHLPDRRTIGRLAGVLTCEKDPQTLHTIQPLYSRFTVKDRPHPHCAERLLCALLFVCFHVFWKQQTIHTSPLLMRVGRMMQILKQETSFVCVCVFLWRFVLLCVAESACVCI